MPLYTSSPFETIPCAKPGTPLYLFGRWSDTVAPTRFLVSKVDGDGTQATVIGTILEGDLPKVGDLITVMGSSHSQLNVVTEPITQVAISRRSGSGTIKFESTWEMPPQEVKFPVTHAHVSLHLILPHWDVILSSMNDLKIGEHITFSDLTYLTDLNGHSRTIVQQMNDTITDTTHAERTSTTISLDHDLFPATVPKEFRFPITHGTMYGSTHIQFSAVNDLQLGETATINGLTHFTAFNGLSYTVATPQWPSGVSDEAHATSTLVTVSASGKGYGYNEHSAETGYVSVIRQVPIVGDHVETGFAKVMREVVMPTPDAAVALITRQPQFEQVHANDKSQAVCLPDSPEGHSVQGFSVDLYSDQISHVQIAVEGANDNRDSAYQELGMIDGAGSQPHRRWDSKDILSANFVRLKVKEIQGGSHASLAARLLLR